LLIADLLRIAKGTIHRRGDAREDDGPAEAGHYRITIPSASPRLGRNIFADIRMRVYTIRKTAEGSCAIDARL
jgi:hypothetical protein